MANYSPKTTHLKATQWQAGQSGNPHGKPKGTTHLSTRIRELLSDDEFTVTLYDAKTGIKEYKGIAMDAVISAAIAQAINGDHKARDWLARFGWGTKVELLHSTDEYPGVPDAEKAADFAGYLLQKTRDA